MELTGYTVEIDDTMKGWKMKEAIKAVLDKEVGEAGLLVISTSDLAEKIQKAINLSPRYEGLVEFVKDVAENGFRCDMNPSRIVSLKITDPVEIFSQESHYYISYFGSAEDHLKFRAANLLKPILEDPAQDDPVKAEVENEIQATMDSVAKSVGVDLVPEGTNTLIQMTGLGESFLVYCEQQAGWSQKIFGPDFVLGPLGPLKHLKKEIDEVMLHLYDVEKWADVASLFIDAMRRKGLTPWQILEGLFLKLEKNRNRTWGPVNLNDEPVEYVRSEEELKVKEGEDLSLPIDWRNKIRISADYDKNGSKINWVRITGKDQIYRWLHPTTLKWVEKPSQISMSDWGVKTVDEIKAIISTLPKPSFVVD